MYCGQCGQQNIDGVKFCVGCGANLTTQTPSSSPTDTLDGAATIRGEGTRAETPSPADTLDLSKTIQPGQIVPGMVLTGQYRIEQRLGSGGMGEVWKATDTELETSVAIKVLPAMLSRDATAIANLKREALIGQQLTHPGICRLYGFHSSGELKFLVMEYVPGKTLAEVLTERDDRKMTWGELKPLSQQIAEALDYAHTASYTNARGKRVRGVLHRDIKPQNIMVTPDGTAKLMDFGIAREIHNSMTQVTGRTSQTPLYASPEQFRGEPLTAASDVYSFAAVLYECLAGMPRISPHGDLGWQILQKPFEPLGSVPDDVNDILRRGLERDTTVRPSSAGALVAHASSPPPPRESSPQPPQTHPAAASTGRLGETGRASSAANSGSPDEGALREARRRQSQTAKALGLTSTTRTLRLPGGETLELVLIPAGRFRMGSPEGEDARDDDEGPQRTVTISKLFWLGRTEVTQAQYEAVTGRSPWKGKTYARENAQHAASYVTWSDATAFCKALSRTTGKTVRLPTEAEWEYACRAGSTTRFSYGDDAHYSNLGDYAWYDKNAYDNNEKYAHPVGKKNPNAWGLHDMHGNVWEWCNDWYQDSYKGLSATDPTGPNNGTCRVLRGGSWYSFPALCRSARRYRTTPDYRAYHYGFRVAVDLK